MSRIQLELGSCQRERVPGRVIPSPDNQLQPYNTSMATASTSASASASTSNGVNGSSAESSSKRGESELKAILDASTGQARRAMKHTAAY